MITITNIQDAIVDNLEQFETFNTNRKINTHHDFFFHEFRNPTDYEHCFNSQHRGVVKKVQELCQDWYFNQFLKGQHNSFEEWYSNATEEEKEECNDVLSDSLNYNDGGHDDLYLFNITWSITLLNNTYSLSFGTVKTQYVFFPIHKAKIVATFSKDTTVEKMETIINKAIKNLQNNA